MKEFIEKLIGRLEEEKNVANNTYMNYELNVDLGRVLGLDKAIEIVNEVASEDSEEVCEWKGFDNSIDENSVDWVYETTCGKYISENHTSSAFQFCPYCGKKIKIAPYQPNECASIECPYHSDGECPAWNGCGGYQPKGE